MDPSEEVLLEVVQNGNAEISEKIQPQDPILIVYVKSGKLNELRKELNARGDIFQKDGDGRTALHHAVVYTSRNLALKMMELIFLSKCLKSGNDYDGLAQLVDTQDINMETALHLAAKLGRKKIVERLLKEDAKIMIKDKDKKTPLDYIYRNVPEVIMTEYDRCVKFKHDNGKISDEQLELDFRPIIGYEDDSMKETNVLAHLLQAEAQKVSPVLQHPLVQAFLYLKYEKALFVIAASIAIHILWYAIYAYFIFNTYFQSCPWNGKNVQVNASSLDERPMEILCEGEALNVPGLPLAALCLTLSTLFLIKEIFEICTVPRSRYFAQLENIGQLLVILSTIWTPWPVYEYLGGENPVTIKPWQYESAAVTVFAVWALVLSQIGKIQRLRLYLEIFVKVFKSFMFFLLAFGSLLLAFSFSFCIIMPETKAFKTPLLALPKVLVMMTGELNYDDIFYTEDSKQMYFTTTQFIFALFTILVTIILVNLLIGLTVSDTQELKNKGHTAQLSSMLEAIYLAESMAIRIYKIYPNKWLLNRMSIYYEKVGCSPFCQKSKTYLTDITNGAGKDFTTSRDTDTELVEISISNKYPFPPKVFQSLKELAENNLHVDEEVSETTNDVILRKLEELPDPIEVLIRGLIINIKSEYAVVGK